MTGDEMVEWHYLINGCEFEQTQGDSEEQGSLAFCSSGITESDMTERLNNNSTTILAGTELIFSVCFMCW